MNPASHVATRPAKKCFEEVDSVLEDLQASSSIAAMDETEPEATGLADDTRSWLFRAHTDSLVQVHPAVLASYANALALRPFFAEVSRPSRTPRRGNSIAIGKPKWNDWAPKRSRTACRLVLQL